MIRAGRALMYSQGYLPTARNTHKTVVEFIRLILGEGYEAVALKFDRMRRRRHDFIYDSVNHISENEAESSLKTAKELIGKITERISRENPQKPLL